MINLQYLYLKMKLTTLNSNVNGKKTGVEKVTKLKKMIQQAANEAAQQHSKGNSNHMLNTTKEEKDYFPKKIRKTPILFSKQHSQSSFNDDKQNNSIKANFHEKTLKQKIHSVEKFAEEESPFRNVLKKSKSNFDITKNNRFKMLTKIKNRKPLSIGMFRLGRKLGKGRFGNVYMAQQIQTSFVLAIKIINKRQLKQSSMEEQLVSELKLQAYTNHPNVLKMYGFFHDTTNIYIMLELAEECLYKSLKRYGHLTEKKAAYYIKQITESLKYLHSQYIIHRDLKPENIMIVNNVAKLGDFGWSVYSPLYKRNTFCGTLDYVPPEIVQGEFYDEKVDIWSLGILMYELTTGKPPFEDHESEDATFMRIISGNMNLPTYISEELKTLIEGILVKNPRERLSLADIDESHWLRIHEKQGRKICQEIWQYWKQAK